MQRLAFLYSDTQRNHAPPIPDPETLQAMRKIIAREQPDIVHAHNWFIHSYLPLKGQQGPPLFLTLHDYSMVCTRKNLLRNGAICEGPQTGACLACSREFYGMKGIPTFFANTVMRTIERQRVDMFIPVSNAVATGNQLAEQRLPYRVIPNFIHDRLLEEADHTHPVLKQLPDGDFMLYVGDLSVQKGIHVMLAAYQMLTDPPPLVLIGRGRSQLAATQAIDASHDPVYNLPPGVIHLGTLPNTAIMAIWQRAILGIIPSIWADPCPTVAMEAMAAGVPLVVSRIGGLIDIVADGETGIAFSPNNATELRDALHALIASAELRHRYALAAKERVRLFQSSTVIPQIEAIYARVAKSTGRTRYHKKGDYPQQKELSIRQ